MRIPKILLITLAMASFHATAADDPQQAFEANQAAEHDVQYLLHDQSDANGTETSQAFGCCKICRKGKACGDSCISREKTCRVGPGCACDR